MRNPIGIVAAGLLLVSTAGCAKGSAESAVAAAEKAVASVQAEAAKVSPVELKAVTDSIAAMKGHIAAGNHRAALMGARSATAMARDLESGIATRKEQLTNSFNAIAADLPKQLGAVTAKIAELGAMRRLPPTVNETKFTALKAEAGGWEAAWATATQAFAGGNLADALSQANAIKTKVADAMATLGIG
ncbi:MAG: hypothetical protein ACKVZ0_17355 [Gemmatimonadales bacterium]